MGGDLGDCGQLIGEREAEEEGARASGDTERAKDSDLRPSSRLCLAALPPRLILRPAHQQTPREVSVVNACQPTSTAAGRGATQRSRIAANGLP